MRTVYFISHPNVVVDPAVPVPRWPLSEVGRARMRALLNWPWVAGLGSVWSSTEQKAIDGGRILADQRGLELRTLEALGENDRSSTGYLPEAEFQSVADSFFARPDESVRGWERAVDAQKRIVAAVDHVIAFDGARGDAAIVSHGGVGALLLASLRGERIGRNFDQPGRSGGNYYAFEAESRALLHAWRPIEPPT